MSDAPTIRFLRDRHGNNVAYSEFGEGPLVICPPWWVSHVEKDWEHAAFRRFFQLLGRGLRLVRYDRPGVGLSDRKASARSLEEEAELLGEIAEVLGDERYGLFANSCAGPIAVRHAVAKPENIERICFYGTYLDGSSICSADIQEAIIATVRAHWGFGSRAMAQIFFPDAGPETLRDMARQARDAASAEKAVELLRQTYAMSVRDIARELSTECLVMHRRGDRAIPFEGGRALAAEIKHARLVPLTGNTHPPWLDGDEIAEQANEFLRGTLTNAPSRDRNDVDRASCRLDDDNRCLVLKDEAVQLTPLEFGVMRSLIDSHNKVVTRDELLDRVWNQPYEGSNRIDAVMRTLRKKLGNWSSSVETVRGHGYRFSGWKRKD